MISFKKIKFRRRGIMALLLVLFQLNSFSQDGTQYPINDPRNPNCPCHKHQQKAEEEFRRLLASASVNSVSIRNNEIQQRANAQQRVNTNRNIHRQDRNINGPAEQGEMNFEPMQMQQINFLELHNPVQEQREIMGTGLNHTAQVTSGTASGNIRHRKSGHTGHMKLRKKKHHSKFRVWKHKLGSSYREFLREFRNVSACYDWT